MVVFVIDDDLEFTGVVFRLVERRYGAKIRYFTNAIEAIQATGKEIPDLVFLDILLDGPDGFTFLNEMQSYGDLIKVPVVVMSSLNFGRDALKKYGVVGYLNKSEMKPEQVFGYLERYEDAER